jgi:hypothetical protein
MDLKRLFHGKKLFNQSPQNCSQNSMICLLPLNEQIGLERLVEGTGQKNDPDPVKDVPKHRQLIGLARNPGMTPKNNWRLICVIMNIERPSAMIKKRAA